MGKRTILVLFFVAFSTSLSGQTPVLVELSKRLEKKTLFIRGFPDQTAVTYDGTGKPLEPFLQGSWTLGQIYIQKVTSKDDEIEILGNRVGHQFVDSGWREKRTDEKQTLTIKVAPVTLPASAGASLLDSIFFLNEKEVKKDPPGLWIKTDETGVPLVNGKTSIEKIGGAVKRPNALATPHSETTKAAKKVIFRGETLLWVVVNEMGKVVAIKVLKPLGMGLDDKAVEQVKQWRFEPATKDGTPVTVAFNVQVSFNND